MGFFDKLTKTKPAEIQTPVDDVQETASDFDDHSDGSPLNETSEEELYLKVTFYIVGTVTPTVLRGPMGSTAAKNLQEAVDAWSKGVKSGGSINRMMTLKVGYGDATNDNYELMIPISSISYVTVETNRKA